MGDISLELARQDYMLAKALQGLSQRTLDDYEEYTGKLLKYLDSNGLDLTTGAIRQWLSTLDVGPVTLGIRIKVLRTFCRWLAAEGYMKTDVMAPIPNPKVPTVFPRVLAEGDIRKLIQTARRKPRDLALVLVLLDTGVRASECCNLTLDDVDLDGRSLLIRNGKGQKDRNVYYSDLTARALRRWLSCRPDDGSDDAVFLSQQTGRRLSRNSLAVAVKRLGTRAGIRGSGCSPHDLRRTFATRWIAGGGDSHSLQRMMGHTTTRMAEKYVFMAAGEVAEAHARYSPVARLTGRRV
jgi:integrase/recombinase XerD